MRVRRWAPAVGLLVVAVAGCGNDRTGPDTSGYVIDIVGGNDQTGAVGELLADPFEVVVRDGGEPVKGLAVKWEVVTGSGATMTPSSATTDSAGIARARLRLGSAMGDYGVEASFTGLSGQPPLFQAHAIQPPVLAGVSPGQVSVGDTITVTGENFSPTASDDVVLFDGIRGVTVEASTTQIRAVVPHCVPTRTAQVTVRIGQVESLPTPLDVTGDGAAPIDLAVGEVLSLSSPAELACVRLPGDSPGLKFLAVQQNASRYAGKTLPFQLVGVTGQAVPLATLSATRPGEALSPALGDVPAMWEARLRQRERDLVPDVLIRRPQAQIRIAATVPSVGDRRTFNVYNKDQKFTTVTAEVKYVSDQAVIYQDVNAPAGGFANSDFADFAALFDDPIFATDTTAFGQPSDLDGNGHVIILFTPVVNELTPKGAAGFVAGFFYGLDLTDQQNSNRAEVFYSLVPDPNGKYGDARRLDDILRTVPPVLAHEFQHMINFYERVQAGASSQEDLWLSEGMAHMAEDLVADALAARGDSDIEGNFRASNYTRAYRYLQAPQDVSMIDVEGYGSLEERGAQWLFVKYLAGQFGGTSVLRALTRSSLNGAANVEAATSTAWETLFNRWSVALWADGVAALDGQLDPVYTFPDLDLRTAFGTNPFPLQPASSSFVDFMVADTLPVASPMHLILQAQSVGLAPLNMSFTRARGGDFAAGDHPQWAILRIQ